MPVEPRGIYRERKGWGDQDSARVKYDEHQELDVPEERYRERGYQPPFDQLPWKDDGANDKKSSRGRGGDGNDRRCGA